MPDPIVSADWLCPDPDGTHVATDGANGPPQRAPSPGSRRYRSVRLHARGSLGQVHLAVDDELNREVALKELQDHCADDRNSRLRFLREAEITAALEHPCIVPIYGRGNRPDGRPFYAMRFIRGESLDDAIRHYHEEGGGTLAFRELLGRFVSVCQAIAYAHSRGVIHRDLKPGNVMLGTFGETLVVDWGLARHVDRPEGDPPSDEAVPISPAAEPSATQAGQVVGTPAYMSPEQASGRRDLGPASDVYSLGGILYAILTGEPPLSRGLASLLLLSECDRTPPPPRLVKNGVPAALEAVCLKAMALDPKDRYASADELAHEVQRYLAGEPVAARPEPLVERWRRWSRRHRSVVSGLTVLLVVGVVGLAAGLWAVSREQGRTAFQRDEALRAGLLAEQERGRAEKEKARAEQEKARAEQNVVKAEKALEDAKHNLIQADKNLLLARKAVDDCFVLATGDMGMNEEVAAPFRRRLLLAALPYYREFQNRKPGEAVFDLDLARNLARLATIEATLGDKGAARLHAGKARQLCAAVGKRDSLSADELQELGDCVNNVGSALHTVGDLADAVAALGEARALQERLIKKRPDDFRALFHLCKMSHNLGLVELARGRTKQALEWYGRSIEQGGALLQKHSGNAELLGLHVASWRGRAGLLDRENSPEEADEAYRQGEGFAEKLLQLGAAPPTDVRAVATTFSDHAAMLSNRGNPAKARRLFVKAISLQETVCAASPDYLYLHDLGIMTCNLGRVCHLLKRHDEEMVACERARRIWSDLRARRSKDESVARMADEVGLQWVRAKVIQIERMINSGDHAASSREIEVLAAEAKPINSGLVNYAAVSGRWLSAFAKAAKVSDDQRQRVASLGLGFLSKAKREGVLNAGVMAWMRKEPSFDPLRDKNEFKELIEPESKEK